MNLRQLEVFHAIIKAGSVTGAARDLCVTQPAVSAVLKHTEQQLRMKLFERIGGRLHPTPEALALLPDVNDIFGRVQAVQRVAQELRDGRAGQLVVATSPTLVNALLPEAVAALRKLSPQLGIYVRSLPTPLAIDRVSRREADMGVVYAPVEDPAVDTTPLAKSEIACVVRKDHPLASRRHVDARVARQGTRHLAGRIHPPRAGHRPKPASAAPWRRRPWASRPARR
ncbi:LysR family transcriptional regulator [Achromobacter sp. DMS1]|uniref:LysR family transcriptional regulator n=1 Tax=Achromobacter sp. DMS1 TaxID=1688405 RepID=UPI00069CD632|nr:LysR family transcriptional regulator [Achromobacter sp. DMS1]